jgi:hypothetical protein
MFIISQFASKAAGKPHEPPLWSVITGVASVVGIDYKAETGAVTVLMPKWNSPVAVSLPRLLRVTSRSTLPTPTSATRHDSETILSR